MADALASVLLRRAAAWLAKKGTHVSVRELYEACDLPLPPRKDVVFLNDAQEQHYAACKVRLERYGVYLDQSVMGAGKTYIALRLAQVLDVPLFVVAPKTALAMWERVAAEYGVPLVATVSYQTLTGRQAYVLSHPWLRRLRPTADEPTQDYFATPEFLEAVRPGVLMVVDEAHNIKNTGYKAKAVTALMDGLRLLRAQGARVYASLVSASPLDKEEMAVQYMRALGVYPRGALRDPQGNDAGYQSFLAHCRRFNPEATEAHAVAPDAPIGELRASLFPLFLHTVVPALASSMPDLNLPCSMENHYYDVESPRLAVLLKRSQEVIKAVTGYNIGDIRLDFAGLSAFTQALVEHEWALSGVAVREALAWLRGRPGGKVVVFVNYNQTMEGLARQMKDLGMAPLCFTSDLTAAERDSMVKRFQTDATCRVFLTNVVTGGVSISLHDTVGNAPRLALLMPTYRILELYQATGRVVRQGMLSHADVRMLYSKQYPLLPVFDALARKSTVLKRINQGANTTTTRKYPGEFPTVQSPLYALIDAGGERSKAWHVRQKSAPFQLQ
jgi:superfamily II DNA or RNA helicase